MFESLVQNRRIRLLYYTTLKRRDGVLYPNWLKNTLGSTSQSLARQVIDRKESEGDYVKFYFKRDTRPLYYPAAMDLKWMNFVIGESSPWHWHQYEITETTVWPDDVVFDCGAAEGLFAYNVSSRCKRVVCFEPLSVFADCMRRTFADVPNVDVVGKGLSSRPGEAFISENALSTAVSGDESGEKIELTTIDDYWRESGVAPTYIKADLEGHEEQMLEGAADCISRFKPRLAITTYHFPHDAAKVVSKIQAINPSYQLKQKGAEHHRGDPLMIHAW